MQNNHTNYIKNILLPCLLFSGITGILTALLIFAFRTAASAAIEASSALFAYVRTNPRLIPLLLGGAILIGLFAALILRVAPNCRGGGIPTAVAILRGRISFYWLKSILLLFPSAILSFLGGMPLGNEGPSVQMGTAVGRGTVRCFAKKNRAWDRYIMTGGACAGFSAATGAPITGILFAVEEAHQRFSPMIFMAASMSVISSSAFMQLLCDLTGTSTKLFNLTIDTVLPLRFIWVALTVGVICGICAILFTKFYSLGRRLIVEKLEKIPFTLKVVVVFAAVALIGIASDYCIGSGHHLIDLLLEGPGVWYLLILYFCVRAIFLVLANNIGITGGLFVPSLAFGAIIGSLCASALIGLGLLPQEYYIVIVTLGMASFLAASSRTPITAVTFAAEVLCGLSNIIPVIMGVTVSFLVIETVGVTAFNDIVIEGKIEEEHQKKKPRIIDTYMTVKPGSFVVGKEIRDILWPPTCVILSVDKSHAKDPNHSTGIGEGDLLHMHYQTYDPKETQGLLEALVGTQKKKAPASMHPGSEKHHVPDL